MADELKVLEANVTCLTPAGHSVPDNLQQQIDSMHRSMDFQIGLGANGLPEEELASTIANIPDPAIKVN